jgi:putative glutamine amidotransferase
MTNKLNKPIIGIVPDFNQGGENNYSKKQFYAIRTSVTQSLSSANATPLILSYDYQSIDQYLEIIDGLVIIGGAFDVDPIRYNENTIHPKTTLNKIRSDFEFTIVKKALENKNFPYLGICNGMQLLSVLFDGKLIQHIPDHQQYINHEQCHAKGFEDYTTPYHDVNIEQNSQLFNIIQKKSIKVNSSHHQGVLSVGDQLRVVARSNDSMIEAVENPSHKFCLGVQWHPELHSSEVDKKIFEALISNSQEYKKNKK